MQFGIVCIELIYLPVAFTEFAFRQQRLSVSVSNQAEESKVDQQAVKTKGQEHQEAAETGRVHRVENREYCGKCNHCDNIDFTNYYSEANQSYWINNFQEVFVK